MTERSTKPRWDEVQRGNTEAAANATENEKARLHLDALHSRVFSTPDGKHLLAYLRSISIERRNPPGDSDGALRELESKRNFVAHIEARIARHETQVAKS